MSTRENKIDEEIISLANAIKDLDPSDKEKLKSILELMKKELQKEGQ